MSATLYLARKFSNIVKDMSDMLFTALATVHLNIRCQSMSTITQKTLGISRQKRDLKEQENYNYCHGVYNLRNSFQTSIQNKTLGTQFRSSKLHIQMRIFLLTNYDYVLFYIIHFLCPAHRLRLTGPLSLNPAYALHGGVSLHLCVSVSVCPCVH